MDQEALERRIRELFGADVSRVSHGQGPKEIDNPAYVAPGTPGFNPTIPPKVTVTEETWTDASGNKLTIQRWPDGTIRETSATTAPGKPRASDDESVSAPPSQQNIVTRKPDGSIDVRPNPNYKPDPVAAENARTEQELNRERQWNSEHGYGWVTHAQRAEQVRQQQAEARQQQNVERQTAAQEAANQLARDRLQFDRDKASLPDVKAQDVNVNGIHYTRVTSITPQGTTTIKNYGPDGKEVAAIPSTGAASVGGPSMLQYIRDGSIQGLTALHEAIWNDPSLTPEQREKRFQEAVQVANIAVQRAATEQNERESVRNAEYNTAVSRLTFMQNGMSGALDFVSKLNGSLPEGSDLGGRAFAALLGLNLLQLQMSGINNLPSLNGPRPTLPPITAADLTNPNRLAAVNQAVAEHAAAAAAPAPAVQNAGAGTGEPPARGALPAQPSMPDAAAPAPTSTTLPPNRPDQTQAAPQIENAINPPAAPGIPEASPIPSDMPREYVPPMNEPNPGGSVLPQGPAQSAPESPAAPAPEPAAPSEPMVTVRNRWTGSTVTIPRSQWNWQRFTSMGMFEELPSTPSLEYGTPETMTPGTPIQVPGEAPGVSVPYPSDAGAVSLGEYPALQAAGIGMAPSPAPVMGQPSSMEMPPAMRRAQIAATVPWRLTPEQMQEAEQNGWLDDALRVPGAA